VVPAGYLAVDATATAALPGWVVSDAQACVVLASTAPALPAGAVPLAADAAKCGGTSSTVSELALNTTDSLAAVNGFIAPPVLPSTAPDGAHYWVMVRAQEGPASADCTVAGTCRWSPWLYYNTDGSTATATYQPLTVVHKGPDSSTPVMSPNPSNGLIPAAGNLGLVDSFDVTATGTSAWANIALGEVFLAPATRLVSAGTPSAPPECTNTSVQPYTPTGCVIFGQGAEMTTTSGFWNTGQTATASAFLPLSELQGLKDGLLRVWVHFKDAAGNWGGFTPADLTLDTTPPIINGLAGGSPANRTLTAHDVPTNGVSGGITGAEWYSGADPGAGNGRAITLSPPGPANSAAVQTYTVTGIPSNARVRVQDAAGNWSTTVTAQ